MTYQEHMNYKPNYLAREVYRGEKKAPVMLGHDPGQLRSEPDTSQQEPQVPTGKPVSSQAKMCVLMGDRNPFPGYSLKTAAVSPREKKIHGGQIGSKNPIRLGEPSDSHVPIQGIYTAYTVEVATTAEQVGQAERRNFENKSTLVKRSVSIKRDNT